MKIDWRGFKQARTRSKRGCLQIHPAQSVTNGGPSC